MLSSHLASAVITFTKPLQRFFTAHWIAAQRNKQRHQQISKGWKAQWSFLRYWKLDQQKKKKNLQQTSAKWKWILGKLWRQFSDKSRYPKKPQTNPVSPTASTNRSPWAPLAAEPALLGWSNLHVQPSEHLEGRCSSCSLIRQSLHLMRDDPTGLPRRSPAGHTMSAMGLWGLGNAGGSSPSWCSLAAQSGWELLNKYYFWGGEPGKIDLIIFFQLFCQFLLAKYHIMWLRPYHVAQAHTATCHPCSPEVEVLNSLHCKAFVVLEVKFLSLSPNPPAPPIAEVNISSGWLLGVRKILSLAYRCCPSYASLPRESRSVRTLRIFRRTSLSQELWNGNTTTLALNSEQ